MTTKEWVDEWRASINDKNFQTYNGKLMFNHESGEMSTKDVLEYLGGWSKNKFMYFVYHQHIKFTKKGYYYIFYKADVDAFMQKVARMEEMKESIA